MPIFEIIFMGYRFKLEFCLRQNTPNSETMHPAGFCFPRRSRQDLLQIKRLINCRQMTFRLWSQIRITPASISSTINVPVAEIVETAKFRRVFYEKNLTLGEKI